MLPLEGVLALLGWQPMRRQRATGWRLVLVTEASERIKFPTVQGEPYHRIVTMYPETWRGEGRATIQYISHGTVRAQCTRIDWCEVDPMVLEILARPILAFETR